MPMPADVVTTNEGAALFKLAEMTEDALTAVGEAPGRMTCARGGDAGGDDHGR